MSIHFRIFLGKEILEVLIVISFAKSCDILCLYIIIL